MPTPLYAVRSMDTVVPQRNTVATIQYYVVVTAKLETEYVPIPTCAVLDSDIVGPLTHIVTALNYLVVMVWSEIAFVHMPNCAVPYMDIAAPPLNIVANHRLQVRCLFHHHH